MKNESCFRNYKASHYDWLSSFSEVASPFCNLRFHQMNIVAGIQKRGEKLISVSPLAVAEGEG
ncbi:MAG: hypothetical protein SPL77_02400, partial [Prevotella sp.]|nr:hypothetical protein [Prevotella sp.]